MKGDDGDRASISRLHYGNMVGSSLLVVATTVNIFSALKCSTLRNGR
jgi:hypothetical protein